MNFDQTFTIDEYIQMLEAPSKPDTDSVAAAKIEEELSEAHTARDNGVKRVRLAFRPSGVNRQWLR